MNVRYEEHVVKSAAYVSDAADKVGAAGQVPAVNKPCPSYKPTPVAQ